VDLSTICSRHAGTVLLFDSGVLTTTAVVNGDWFTAPVCARFHTFLVMFTDYVASGVAGDRSRVQLQQQWSSGPLVTVTVGFTERRGTDPAGNYYELTQQHDRGTQGTFQVDPFLKTVAPAGTSFLSQQDLHARRYRFAVDFVNTTTYARRHRVFGFLAGSLAVDHRVAAGGIHA